MSLLDLTAGAHSFAQALGWTLVHFLWQGLLVALVLELVLRALPDLSASVRYLVRCAALLAMAVLPVATFAWLRASSAASASDLLLLPAATPDELAAGSPDLWPLAVAALWFVGAAAFGARLVRDYLRVRRVRDANAGSSLPIAWQARFDELSAVLGVRAIARVVDSAALTVPTVIGCFRPVVLLPARVLTGLSEDQVLALLAHELAHVRRHDFLVNLFQSAIEAVLFYHPAVWFVSKGIRAEREYCCDDVALAITDDRLGYARALTTLESWRGVPLQPAMSTLGGPLMKRIQRMVTPRENRGLATSPAGAMSALGALLVTVVLGATAYAAPTRSDDGDELAELRAKIVEMQAHLDKLRAKLDQAEAKAKGKPDAGSEADAPDERATRDVIVHGEGDDGPIVLELSPEHGNGVIELRSSEGDERFTIRTHELKLDGKDPKVLRFGPGQLGEKLEAILGDGTKLDLGELKFDVRTHVDVDTEGDDEGDMSFGFDFDFGSGEGPTILELKDGKLRKRVLEKLENGDGSWFRLFGDQDGDGPNTMIFGAPHRGHGDGHECESDEECKGSNRMLFQVGPNRLELDADGLHDAIQGTLRRFEVLKDGNEARLQVILPRIRERLLELRHRHEDHAADGHEKHEGHDVQRRTLRTHGPKIEIRVNGKTIDLGDLPGQLLEGLDGEIDVRIDVDGETEVDVHEGNHDEDGDVLLTDAAVRLV